MSSPSDDEERQEWPVSRPLSHAPPPLDIHGLSHTPYRYNVPGPLPPPPFDTSNSFRVPSSDFPAIRPFRAYNYLQSPGEDLSSRVYTLGQDNLWEVNGNLTSEYRQFAQHTPQFTSTYEPGAHWNPHQVWRATEGGGGGQSEPRPYENTGMGYTDSYHTPQPYQSPSASSHHRYSPPNSAPVAGPSNGPGTLDHHQPQRHGRRNSESSAHGGKKKKGYCRECNKTFYRKAEYDRHMKTSKAHIRQHSDEPMHECFKCGREFRRADAKLRHEKLCDGRGKHPSYD